MKRKFLLLLYILSSFTAFTLPNFKRIADFRIETTHSLNNTKSSNDLSLKANASFAKESVKLGTRLLLNANQIQNDKKLKELSGYIRYQLPLIINDLEMSFNTNLSLYKVPFFKAKFDSKILTEFNIKYKNEGLNYEFNTALMTQNFSKNVRLNNKINVSGRYSNIEFIKINTEFENGFTRNSSFLIDNELQAGYRPTKETRLVFYNRFKYISKKEDNIKLKKAGLHLFSADLINDNEFTNNFNISLNYTYGDFTFKNINLVEAVYNNNNYRVGYGTKNVFTYSPFNNAKSNNIVTLARIHEIGKKSYWRFVTSYDIEYSKRLTKQLTLTPKFLTEFKVDNIIDSKNTKLYLKLVPSLDIIYKFHPLFVFDAKLKSTLDFNNNDKKRPNQFVFSKVNLEAKFGLEYIWR